VNTTAVCCTFGRRNETSVRRVLDAEIKNGTLRLAVKRMGQAPTVETGNTPTARRAARAIYEQKLRKTLERHFAEFEITKLKPVELAPLADNGAI
jgi:2-iminoacetate synthase ThiH